MAQTAIRYVECPRDAWQGFSRFIPTEEKVAFLKKLLEAGFRHLDLTSFVSPKWVPQMADAEEVLASLPPPQGRTYLAIVANEKGLERALKASNLTAIGYPFSLSETFQRKNTNRSREESWPLVKAMVEATEGRLGLVVYLSMAFGNPYGDPWSVERVLEDIARLRELGVREIALADTYGVAEASRIQEVLGEAVARFGPEGLGAHLHARPEGVLAKVEAVLAAGILWLEGTLAGVGGCPFAGDELVGNLPTEKVLPYLEAKGFHMGIDLKALPELAGEAARLKLLYG
ncbi:hydroxymethylglutaryl-CoA lyase [Thermus scotoductus]|uniref:Hydroxymethylglutaryl-CoA lyase n=1 Tax=Thermus scotoductus TaxID=37636 RepID=A0A430RV78_THESC|nr:hydroxymethylglutaryl-CoA lyase [Thermus scotoductus]RTG94651.1 hydroxymethylglutaryl-CoA lyase [Thermus scotoductus]RTH23832.1 hydroxymethylglutaryl-CoA lyase [Thermus scotoductus]